MTKNFTHQFVEFIPDVLADGVLYISVNFATAVHKCCCGCGNQVVTPLSPTDWKLIFDGETVSLSPSIGNWNFACRSHYWILQDRVVGARRWSQQQIDNGRSHDRIAKEKQFAMLAQDAPPSGSKKSEKRIGRRRKKEL